MGVSTIIAGLLFQPVKFIKEVGNDIKMIEERKLKEAQAPKLNEPLTAEEIEMIEVRRQRKAQGK